MEKTEQDSNSNQKNQEFIFVMDERVGQCRSENRYGQARRLSCARNSFFTFLTEQGQPHLAIVNMNQKLISNYEDWLQRRGLRKNSTSCYMRALQSVYSMAIAERQLSDCRPFAHVYKGIARTRKRAASMDIIRQLMTLHIRNGLIALGKNPRRKPFRRMLHRLELARDLFIFSYCAQGMSFVDLAHLRKVDIHRDILYYTRCKTGQQMEVEVMQQMQDIIDRYARETEGSPFLFPLLHNNEGEAMHREYQSALRTFNAQLKVLSKMLGQNVCLTSYVARHSWASNLYQQGTSLAVISRGMGHENELTTQIYIKSLEDSMVHQVNRRFIDKMFSSPLLRAEAEIFIEEKIPKSYVRPKLTDISHLRTNYIIEEVSDHFVERNY